jgi:ABC-type sugar transport system, permease component
MLKRRKAIRWQRAISKVLSYTVAYGYALIILFPLTFMALTAFKPRYELFAYPPTFLPREWTLDNFQRVFQTMPYATFLKNTLLVTAAVVLCQLALSATASFAFARLRFRGRDALFALLLISLMVPSAVTMVPTYILMRSLGWINEYWGVIVPMIFSNIAFGVFFMRQYLYGIPVEIEEAAAIEGASTLRLWWSIILPNCRPALATLAVITFVTAWNAFLWPLIVLNSQDKFVLSIGLMYMQGQYSTDWAGIMAGTLVTVLPIVVAYVVLQKHFVEAVHMSGIK